MKNCHICPLLVNQTADSDGVIMQTDHWVVVLDRNQSYLGKSFITLRRHKATLSDLDQAEWQDLHEVIRRMERAIKSAFGADVCNWECLMNNAIKAGRPTHVHWHLHPRYLSSAVFAGQEFTDPKWPRIVGERENIVSDEVFSTIVTALRSEIRR